MSKKRSGVFGLILVIIIGAASALAVIAPQGITTSIEVINNGIGGQNSRDIVKQLPDILKLNRPDMVIIMVGTNDCLNSSKPVEVAEFVQNLKKISNICRSHKINVLLMTIPPCYGSYLLTRHPAAFFGNQPPEEKVKVYNSAIRTFAAGENISVLDINRIFSAVGNVGPEKDSVIRNIENSNAQDGVHSTAEGYKLIAVTVYQWLDLQKAKPSKIACVGDSITFGVHVKGEGTATGQTYPALLSKLLNTK